MKLSDLRNKAKKGIKAPKRKRRDTPIDPIKPIHIGDIPVDISFSPSVKHSAESLARAMSELSKAGALTKKQAEKLVQLTIDKSVINNGTKERKK